MSRRVLVLALGVALAACGRPPAPPAPNAQAERQCAEAATPEARVSACDLALAQEGIATEQRIAALAHRGEAKRQSGDPTGALADFNAALALDGDNADAKLGRAAVLLHSGQLDAAAPLIDAVLQTGASPSRAHLLRGELYMRQSNATSAISEFDASIAADGRYGEALAARGVAKQGQRDYDGAAQDFDAALRIDDSNADARVGRCWNRIYRSGDLAASLRDAETALTASPSNTDAQLCRGLINLRREDWEGARAAYDAVLLTEPANAAALFGRGFARRESGERGEGAADIRRAYDFNAHIDEEFERLGVDF